MNHEEMIEKTLLLLDGELQAGERAGAEAHIAACAECRLLRQAAAGAARLLRAEPLPPASADFVAAVMRRLPQAGEADPLPVRVWLPVFAAGLAAIILLLQPAPPPAAAADGAFLVAELIEEAVTQPVPPPVDDLLGISLENP